MEILIITNNSTEAKQWQKLLNKYPNTNAVISNFKNAAAFIEDNDNPDIIFLEANSEEELNFPEKIDCPSPLVVISDDANLCLAAFQLNTFNYHIKPIEEEDFKQSIKKYYFLAGRVPEVAKKLKISLQKLATYQDDFDNSIEEVSLELTKVDVVLKSLSRKLDGDPRHSVVALRDKIRDYKPKSDGKEPLINIYVGIYRILEELDELQKDSKWER